MDLLKHLFYHLHNKPLLLPNNTQKIIKWVHWSNSWTSTRGPVSFYKYIPDRLKFENDDFWGEGKNKAPWKTEPLEKRTNKNWTYDSPL